MDFDIDIEPHKAKLNSVPKIFDSGTSNNIVEVKYNYNVQQNCGYRFNVCQCCSDTGFFKNMFHKYEYMNRVEVYADMLHKTFNIQLPIKNALDYHICVICIKRLRDADSFKQQALETQSKLNDQKRQPNKLTVNHFSVKQEPSSSELYDRIQDDSLQDDNDSDWLPEESLSLNTLKQAMIKYETELDDLTHQAVTNTETILKDTPKTRKTRGKLKNCNIKHKIKETVKKNKNKGKHNQFKGKIEETDRLKNMKSNTLTLLRHSNACLYRYKFNKFECYRCKTFFISFKDLRDHTRDHAWDEIEKDINSFYQILYRKVDISNLKCIICNAEILNLTSLRLHLIEKHGIQFVGEENLLVPYRVEDLDFKCVICNDKFSNYCKLNQHTNRHFQSFICEVCGSGFICKKNMLNHMQKAHEKKKIFCFLCNIEFKSSYHKDLHNTKVHDKAAVRVCLYCPERFHQHTTKILHMVKAHGHKIKQHNCESCDKSFISNSLLKSHVKVAHMKLKEFECDQCGARFGLKHHLNVHLEGKKCKGLREK